MLIEISLLLEQFECACNGASGMQMTFGKPDIKFDTIIFECLLNHYQDFIFGIFSEEFIRLVSQTAALFSHEFAGKINQIRAMISFFRKGNLLADSLQITHLK